MHKFSTFALAVTVMLFSISAVAQTAPRTVAPAKTTAVTTVAKPAAPSATVDAASELIALLPPSDLVAVLDANRVMNDVLPKLAGLSIGGLDKMATELAEFTQKTGIDPNRLSTAVAGFTMKGTQANGALLVRGAEFDARQMEAALKEFKTEYTTSEYKGKTIYTFVKKVKAPEAGPLTVKTDETAAVLLSGSTLALGDVSVLKRVVDAQIGGTGGGPGAQLTSALGEARPGALIRFALNLPPELRQEAAAQGDLFKSVSTIKTVIGGIDLASDLSLSFDSILRTSAAAEASELESSLKGVVSLVRGLLGGGGGSGDPKMDLFGQMLDAVKIGARSNDVTLSLAVPRSFFDQFFKKSETEKAATEKKP